MRLLALFPVVWTTAPVVLCFLCIFAGSKEGFMEDHHILTLSANLTDALNGTLVTGLGGNVGNASIQSVFASTHLLTTCWGFYTNESTAKQIAGCSGRKMFSFDPLPSLQTAHEQSGHDRKPFDLHIPDDIRSGLHKLHHSFNAASIFYIFTVTISLSTFLNYVLGLICDATKIDHLRGMVGTTILVLNPLVVYFAFLASVIASSILTAVAVKAAKLVNQHGVVSGIQANFGGKFVGLTWANTAALVLVSVLACLDFCFVSRKVLRDKKDTHRGAQR